MKITMVFITAHEKKKKQNTQVFCELFGPSLEVWKCVLTSHCHGDQPLCDVSQCKAET